MFFGVHLLVAQSCNFKLQGVVVDEHNKAPLAFTTVYLPQLEKGTITDEDGKFAFVGLCSGMLPIQVQHLGAATILDTLFLSNDTTVLFMMEHHTKVLETITITANKTPLPLTQSVATLDELALKRLSGQSLGTTLESIAGVQTLQTGPTIAKPIIHGLHSDRILILNNGIRQEGQLWGLEHAPEIDPFVADQLRVVKGAAAVQYGADAMGGVILVEPAPLPETVGIKGALHGVLISNGRQGVLSSKLEGVLKALPKLAWRVNGTLKKAGDAQAPNYLLTNTGADEANFSATTGYHHKNTKISFFYSRFSTNLGILRSSHIGNLTDFQAAILSTAPLVVEDFSYQINAPRQKVVHQLLKTTVDWTHESLGDLQLIYSFQQNARQEYDIRRNSEDARPALDLDLNTHQVALKLDHRFWKTHSKGTIGITYENQENRNTSGTGVRPLIPFYDSQSAGLFWIERWTLPTLTLESGVRYDVQQLVAKKFDTANNLITYERQFQSVVASLGMIWKLNALSRFHINIGSGFRAPNAAELFSEGLHHGVAAIEQGNENLQLEKALKWINTWNYEHQHFQVEATAYSQWIKDFIYLKLQAQPRLTIRGAFPVFDYTQTNAHLYGLDVQIKTNIAQDFVLSTKGSLLRARDTKNNIWLQYMPSDRIEASFAYEPKPFGQWKDLQIQLTGSQVWRQSRAPAEVLNLQDFNASVLTFNTFEIPAPNGYFLMNMQLGGTLQLGNQAIFLQLTLKNIWNTAYRAYLNRLRYYADDIGRSLEVRIVYSF